MLLPPTSIRSDRVVIGKIAQQDSERIPNPPVGVAESSEHFLREGNIVGVIDAADPQPNEIGAVAVDEMTRVHRLVVGARLGDFLSVDIDHETVRDTGFVGRAIVQRDTRHER